MNLSLEQSQHEFGFTQIMISITSIAGIWLALKTQDMQRRLDIAFLNEKPPSIYDGHDPHPTQETVSHEYKLKWRKEIINVLKTIMETPSAQDITLGSSWLYSGLEN